MNDVLFPIVQNRKWGFIDVKGQVVLPPQYDKADDFSEGLALVWVGTKAQISPDGSC